GFSGIARGFRHPVGVFAAVAKLERIHGPGAFGQLHAAIGVKQCIDAFAHADAQVVTAFGADIERCLEVFLVEDGLAGGALDPDSFRNTLAAVVGFLVDARGKNLSNPAHRLFLISASQAAAVSMAAWSACAEVWPAATAAWAAWCMVSINLLPMTTASAHWPSCRALSASRMPKPTPTGMDTCSRM